MSLYLDTSCLLKLLFPEPESRRGAQPIEAESGVVVSALARLEALGQLQARVAGGILSAAAGRALPAVRARRIPGVRGGSGGGADPTRAQGAPLQDGRPVA